MNRALLACGWMAVLLSAGTGCMRADGAPEVRGAGAPSASEGPTGRGWVAWACERGEVPRQRADACLTLAGYYQEGRFGFPQDPQRAGALSESAVDVLVISCEGGLVADCTGAAAAMSRALRPGGPRTADEAEAAGWMVEYAEDGCRGGDPSGCTLLGVIYDHGLGVPPDASRAVAYHEQACSGGHRQSCLLLASRAEGSGAVGAYERACRAGSGFACATAAQHHRKGAGVERSLERAGELFEQGCTLGDPASCVLGAEMYANDGAPDLSRAMKLSWAGCRKGIAGACMVLGEVIERGPHRRHAGEYYQRACELGEEKGCARVRTQREAERRTEYFEIEGEGD